MIIVGLSGGHDANLAVWRDGEIVAAIEKERFTRERHAGGEVVSLVPKVLAAFGMRPEDIDLVATSEPVALGEGPGHELLGGRRYENLTDWQWQTVRLLGRVLPCLSVPHHLAHAAYARYTSSAERTAVITLDGGGDQYTVNAGASTCVSSWGPSGLEWIERVDYCDFGSLWAGYARAVFGPGQHEGKLMGLAALGTDRFVDVLRETVLVPDLGSFRGATVIKNCWPDYRRAPLLPDGADWRDQRAKDAAYAVQAITNEAAVSLAEVARAVTGQQRLALAGGVALNGYLVSEIERRAGFESVHVPPAVNDGGIGAGAALFAAHDGLGVRYRPEHRTTSPFLGLRYPRRRIADALGASGLRHREAELDCVVRDFAERLADGEIVAWFEGRSEHGPRALGARSILASPLSVSNRDRLNRDIKLREPFRPVAPAVLEDAANTWFELDRGSPYMMRIVQSRAGTRDRAPGAVHADGSARVQTVRTEDSLGRLIAAFANLTGVPLLINTSLNVRTPIVETPEEAIGVLGATSLDATYIDGYVAEKHGH